MVVLLVDDSVDAREAMAMYMTALGYKVHQASTGEEALDACRKFRPQVVLMDLLMPGMDGVTAATVLRRRKKTRDVPIVAISGKVELNDYAAHGFDDFLQKPVGFSVLENILRRHVEKKP